MITINLKEFMHFKFSKPAGNQYTKLKPLYAKDQIKAVKKLIVWSSMLTQK